jgi:hypothetical protein
LPEKLWVFHELREPGPKRSQTPVIQPLMLKDGKAFPAFFIPSLSSLYGLSNPVLSHPDSFKFLLFWRLCEETLKRFGSAGCLIHNEHGLNDLGMTGLPHLC